MGRSNAPNLMFSHFGITVGDLPTMQRFYTDLMGFSVTDRGQVAGIELVFLSRDPMDHHQLILGTGRPDSLPENKLNKMFGPCINQISFRMGSIVDLRDMHGRLKEFGYKDSQLFVGNHGIAWSIYFPDPEGNNLELFVDTEWYIDQPFLIPLDFTKSDDEIYELTKDLCSKSSGFEPIKDWRQRISRKMTAYKRNILDRV